MSVEKPQNSNRILMIADDSDMIRNLVARMVKDRRSDLNILLASNGNEAVAHLMSSEPDGVILDNEMGEGPTGLTIVKMMNEGKVYKPKAVGLQSGSLDLSDPTVMTLLKSGTLTIFGSKPNDVPKVINIITESIK